ncbi:uncharacterized protein FTOL_13318 [Fusarium torulosum]|uniref:Uncharacterized protein n=1 Tax=Fusarium torulosum TaxID=33205 RepID=A0AAE8MNM3_9HYPO|nr:uncharacterized protein FTOL_13318 [Fusarium torulosum]
MWMLTKKFITNSVDYGPNEKNETKDLQAQKVKKTITAAQLMSLTGYFILENTAWLSMRGVLKWSKKSQSKFLGWCARCWCIYVIAELGRLLHERARDLPDGEQEDMKSRLEWKKKIVQVSMWLPLSIHYVSSSAVLPEPVAAFLATYAEFITLKGQWDATAEKI